MGDKTKSHTFDENASEHENDDAVRIVNNHKQIEETLLRLCDRMRVGRDEHSPFDQRWLAVAVTHFEQGFMALNRAVFKPGRVRLPGDSEPTDPKKGKVEGMAEG